MNKFEQPSQDEEKKELKFGSPQDIKAAIFRNKLDDENAQQNIINSLKKAGQELSHQQEQSIGNALAQNEGDLDKLSETIFEILKEEE